MIVYVGREAGAGVVIALEERLHFLSARLEFGIGLYGPINPAVSLLQLERRVHRRCRG